MTIKKILLTTLEPGMYVEKFSRQNRYIQIKKPGKVTAELISTLLKQGVRSVYIDLEKSQATSLDAPIKIEELEAETEADYSQEASVSLDVELPRATRLYKEAKYFQDKALKDAAAGRKIDVEVLQGITEGIIDSIFNNQDALGLLSSIREKDQYLLEHSINVSILMGIFAKYLRMSKEDILTASLGGMIHDLGKTRIDDAILNKPDKLTETEFEIMKSHTLYGASIVEASTADLPVEAFNIVLQHHEKLDGSGYPHGKSGDEICQFVRMSSICDIYDALTADRVYKKGMLPSEALGIIHSMAPHQLDQQLVHRFVRCFTPYPLGCMVRLNNDQFAIVIGHNKGSPTKPKVKMFYDVKKKVHIPSRRLNLLTSTENIFIVSAELPADYGLNLMNYV